MDGKPWANAKSVTTEKLLLDIFAIIYHAGYSFLSNVDYGRDHDDRLAMAFSRPSASEEASPSSTGSLKKRVPFALSFASTTLLRVISPPLHLTPAILQAVRGAWPRGVVSEKKVGDNCYEFKLKGYKWFQQDNFASDSLQHILTLLSSLDSHSFTLTTSLALTNRSRVKDLWVFTGPADAERSSLSILDPHNGLHRRQGSEPLPLHSQPSLHRRAATDDASNQPHTPTTPVSSGPHLLRKPAPRAQVPISVIQEQEPDEPQYDQPYNRTHLPSMISTAENMTGVGARGHRSPDYPPFESAFSTPPVARRDGSESPTGSRSPSPATPQPQRQSPPLLPPLLGGNAFRANSDDMTRNSMLSATESDISRDIPIKWTGGSESPFGRSRTASSPQNAPAGWPTVAQDTGSGQLNSSSPASPFQGTATTPIQETVSRIRSPELVHDIEGLRHSEAALVGVIAATSVSPSPNSANASRSATPIMKKSPAASENGKVVGNGSASQLLPPPTMVSSSSLTSTKSSGSKGSPARTPTKLVKPSGDQGGWVFVRVDSEGPKPEAPPLPSSSSTDGQAKSQPQSQPQSESNSPEVTPKFPSYIPAFLAANDDSEAELKVTNATSPLSASTVSSPSPNGALHPATEAKAKAIVIVDALENTKGESPLGGRAKDSGKTAGGGVRRFLSLTRKNSRKKLNASTFNEAEDVTELGGLEAAPIQVEKAASAEMPQRPAPQPLVDTPDSNDTDAIDQSESSTGDVPASLVTAAPASPTTIPRSFIRDRLRLFGKPAASTKPERASFE
ncbi:hypothetical protein BKA70DRAFT_1434434 [Coprinopsis sp. MPI-PUGE-AT-0042]|nr:hypothetical protein BKA70DRAFT_1434434 [Coprinopsis sp. MPI-PUGE-AT-0042]